MRDVRSGESESEGACEAKEGKEGGRNNERKKGKKGRAVAGRRMEVAAPLWLRRSPFVASSTCPARPNGNKYLGSCPKLPVPDIPSTPCPC